MVRETRHLWVGNLSENVREEEIRDLFQRHGRVQSVKLLEEPNSNNLGRAGKNATVAFIDIRSASKALRNVRTVGYGYAGQPIHITYYEPGSAPPLPPSFPLQNNHTETPVNPSETLVPLTQGNLNSNTTTSNNVVVSNNCIPNTPGPGMFRQRFSGQHGQSEDSSSHFYDQPKSFSRGRGDGHGFHGRGRRENRPPFHNRHSFPADNSRNYRSQWNYHHEGRYAPPVHSDVEERPPVSSPATHTPPSESGPKPPRRAESPASSVSSRHLISKRRRSRSVSDEGSSDRGSSVGSRSRSGGSRSSVSTSVSSSSRSRSPSHHGHFQRSAGSNDRFHHSGHSRHRYSRSRVVTRGSDSRIRHNSRSPLAASPSSSTSSSPSPHRKISATHSPSHSPSSSKSYSPSRNAGGSQHHNNHHHHRRAPSSAELLAAIKIRNLPIRSSDTSLKDGLYHEYKKHGKVAWVRVNGVGPERFAIVCFKSTEHATRAVAVSQGKLFFGCKIQVTPYKHTKGEEIIGGQDEENRLIVEDEPSSSYPTRTVLITGLDAMVTSTELQSVFDQYGDIVRLDIRKQGTATHAACEFVDISSAIRAQWGRHVFKSKEARISFFRNPPSNALMLDGTSGVTDKQVYGQCCQYGAIKSIVMDPERVLALVQFQEISEAQAAIRQLRSWIIKGKRLQVDFASPEVIRRVVQRVTGVVSSPIGSSSPGLISSPSIGNSVTPLHDTINIGRKMNTTEEDDEIYNTSEDADSYRVSKTDRNQQRRIIPSSKSQLASINSEIGTVDSVVFPNDKSPYSIRPYTSPVSPDPDHSASGQQIQNSSVKCSGTSRIDFNCHETDSAVVTSSSDIVVGEKSDAHSNSGMSFDGKNGYTELDGDIHALDTTHGALTFVDGVSSTSPEPKSETVRKASPDSGVSLHSVPRPTVENRPFFKGVDPRRQPSNLKIRRSSADSGNNAGTVSSHNMHSTSSIFTPSHPPASTTAENTQIEDESDDRPGTPLCDENPESFESPEAPNTPPKPSSFTLNTKMDPISLPLPEFALQSQRHRTNSNTSSKEFPSSSVRISRSSIESDVRSPAKSPSPLLTNSPRIPSPMELEEYAVSNEDQLSPTTSWKDASRQNTSPTPVTYHKHSNENWTSEQHLSSSMMNDNDNDLQDPIGSPDSDVGIWPTNSPTSASLEQRILKCCETYDRFSGSKPSTSETINSDVFNDSTCVSQVLTKSGSSTDSSSDSPSSRFKFLDWTELMLRPSDIGKSVLARKSVFDEDSKRLENFGEKYEAKGPSTPTSTTWRAIALQRSLSVSSTAGPNNWHHPHTPHGTSGAPLSHMPSSIVTASSRSLSLSMTPIVNNFSPKSAPIVFQPTQPKPTKDLNYLSNISSKLVKLEPMTKIHPLHPQPPPLLQSNLAHDKLPCPKTLILEPQKSLTVKTSSDTKDIKDKSQNVDSLWIPSVSAIASVESHILSSDKSIATCAASSSAVPRPVERSISLDFKKVPGSQKSAPTTEVMTLVNDSIHNIHNESKGVPRRSSIDTPTLAPRTSSEHITESNLAQVNVKLESPTLSLATSTNSTLSPTADKSCKESVVHKTDFELMKRDISGIRPIQQETTVAVVASEQITFIPSRSDSVSSSSTKDSSRKDKEKKRRSSGSSNPVSSLPPNTFLNASRSDQSTPHSSSRENVSNKRVDDKKEKKDRENKITSEPVAIDNSDKDDGSRKSGDKRDGKKEKRDSHKESAEHSRSSLSESHHQQSHRREKESTSTKRKRDSSGNEGDAAEQKKVKLEKDVQEVTLNRLKAASTNERRESRDSSSSNKERNKEGKESSSRTSSISLSSETHIPKDKKDDSKSKENHYRSKDKSSSSSKDKHYEKSRPSSESRSAHQSSKSDFPNKDKERVKKDRAGSPGKENVKGSSKHHAHSSSSHRNSTSSKKESTSSSGTSSKIIVTSENTKRPQVERHNTSIDSDSCGESNTTKFENSDSHSRSKSSKSSQSKSSRSEKRDSNAKRDRHRSGDPSSCGDSERKKREDHKRKKFVVEETESSDSDDEDKKRHHSIFEVVIDEYVSMYDKVKARSNRACKAQPHQPQVEEVKKKEDKIKDQFRALKQSRAKKIEKKRSTSVDESNKSGVHTSSDEEILEHISADASHIHSKLSQDGEPNLTPTSDEDEAQNERSRMKSLKKIKSKKRSSAEKKKGKKSGKSPPPKSYQQRSMESVFTNSECESNASSHAEPQKKKKKISMSKLSFPGTSLKSQEYKSSEESISDSESERDQKVDTTSKGLNKLNAIDVYSSDSDSSVQSGPVRLPTPPIKMSNVKTKTKEKHGKQKSMKKSLFESSDSSEEDKRPPLDTRKDKKDTQQSKSKERESKIGRKKHRGHSSLLKSGKSKSRVGSGDGSVDSSSLVVKRESTSTMKDILFGPMSASSGSENDDGRLSGRTPSRPKTPTITSHESPRKIGDITHSPKKTKSIASEERKCSRSISPCSSLEMTSDILDFEQIDANRLQSSAILEKKRRKHHKDKKSKRSDDDTSKLHKTPKSSASETSKPDLDSLFNSPRVSPCKEYMSPRIKQESISEVPANLQILENRATTASPIKNNVELNVPGEATKSMFSSDEDDDDDKLKIDINEAIIASSDEPGLEITDQRISNDKRKREEEEKQMNSLFEQDKAIESIVLLDRKSPPVPCPSSAPEDDTTKDDLPKDGTAISQEETEDAVAALLETLEGDDDMEETRPVKSSVISTVAPVVHSPPTLRIIEDTTPLTSFASEDVTPQGTKLEKVVPTSWSSLEPSTSLDTKYDKPNIPSTPEIGSRKSSLDDSNTISNSEDKISELSIPLRRTSCSTKSRQCSAERDNDDNENSSADIYEFHDDSDDETSNKKQGQIPHAKMSPILGLETTIKSPLSSPPLPPPVIVVNSEVKTPMVSPTVSVITPSHSNTSTVGQPTDIPVTVQPTTSPTITTSSPFTVNLASADPLIMKPSVLTPPSVQRSKTPPVTAPVLTTPIRNKVDDTIEHVIRMAVQNEDPFWTPASTVTITSVKASARGRSRSRDSGTEETGPICITRVLQRPELALHLPSNIVTTGLLAHHPADTTQGIKSEPDTVTTKEDATETLIDPQTGILMPMIRQSEEGQYAPIVGQGQESSGGLPKVQQPQFSVPCFQKEHDGLKPDEKPYLSHPTNAQKSEGLAATMFSHPQVFQIGGQNQYVIPQSSAGTKVIHQPRFSTPMLGHRQISPDASATIYMTKASTPHYVGPSPSQAHGIRMSNINSPGRSSHEFGPSLHKPVSHDSIPVSISHLGAGPTIRAIFPGGGVPQILQSGQYQYAVISKTELPPAQMSPRQTSNPPQPMMQNIAKYGAPSGIPPHAQGQTEIKSFQIPSATTITKVNNGQEESMQRKNIIITSQPSIMLSSPVTSLRSVSPNVIGAKTYSSAPSMSMTRQQQQQHHAQTEIFHKSAEGLIRVNPKDEQMHSGNKNQQSDIALPPRVDINVNIAHAAASSPKGRIIGHDQYQTLPSRMPQYTLAESGEVRIVSASSTSIPDHSTFVQRDTREYVNYNVPAGSPPTSGPMTSLRPGMTMPEKMDFNKLNPILAQERNNRMAQQQNIQHSMPHLPSPHAIDQRNSESPVVNAMYASHVKQPQIYQTPSPAHQHQGIPRDNFKIVYADQVERPHANSPSYSSSFDPRVGVPNMIPDRERVLSPYVLQQRLPYSPPPAHGRYSVPPQGAEAPAGDRQQRIMNTQTPPHGGLVPSQGDTLLMLLQRYPIMWQGLLALKNDNAACQMHFVSGNLDVARESLPTNPDGSVPPLRISQRMRLDQAQLEGVARKMQIEPEHCILLALPCGRDHMDVLQQSNNLRNGFITYLQLKQAAGIVNICHPTAGGQQPAFVIHIFPSCDFANENLARIAPDLLHGVADIAHLLIVVAQC